MKRYTVYQVDSFTTKIFEGNPAGVVLHADGLTPLEMQIIARELNNSETAFLFSSTDKYCDGELRYFTPQVEVPTCGHATIAAMMVYAHEQNLGDCTLRIKTQVGILPMAVLPVLYFLTAALILKSLWLLIAAIVLAIGHLSESWNQYRNIMKTDQ